MKKGEKRRDGRKEKKREKGEKALKFTFLTMPLTTFKTETKVPFFHAHLMADQTDL